MADIAAEKPEGGRKGRSGLLVAVALAAAGAGGGFALTRAGILDGILGGGDHGAPAAHGGHGVPAAPFKTAFVPVPPLTISLHGDSVVRHLRFQAQLEVERGEDAVVEAVMPRIVDVLNGYLRAVALAEIENPASLVRLRAQMLRRVQIIVGEDAVRDLLIQEFVVD